MEREGDGEEETRNKAGEIRWDVGAWTGERTREERNLARLPQFQNVAIFFWHKGYFLRDK